MRASCTICSDIYDQYAIIVSCNCGHVFHEECLRKWLDQSHTCPECRQAVKKKALTKLFFNILPENDNTSGSAHLENRITSLMAEISAKNAELRKSKEDQEQLRKFATIAEEKNSSLEQQTLKLKSEQQRTNLILRDAKKKASKIDNLEVQNAALMKKIELYNNVNMLIQGTQKDVDDVLQSMQDTPGAIHNLVTSCSLLKRELKHAMDSKGELRHEIASLRRENGIMKCNINKLSEKTQNLQLQLKSLEKENISLMKNDRPHKDLNAKAAVCFESPMPDRMKDSNIDDIRVTPVSERPDEKFKKRKLGISRYEISQGFMSQSLKPVKKFDDDLKIVYSKFSQNDDNSIIRIGYNGLGGHSNFVGSSKHLEKGKIPPKKK